MITRIEAMRYRCFENIGIDIPKYGVLVGANGAGKTTLLDIPRVISDCLRQRDITQAFTQRQQGRPPRCAALKELIFCLQGNEFILCLEVALPEQVVMNLVEGLSASQKKERHWLKYGRYEIRLEIFNDRQLQVKNEYLFLFSESSIPDRSDGRLHGETAAHRDWRFVIKREYGGDTEFRVETQKGAKSRSSKVEPAMLALPRVQFESKAEFPAAAWLYDVLTREYLFYQPELKALQAASPPGLQDTLMPDAANLPHLVMELQKDEFRFGLWQDHVKTALPQIARIEVKEREEDHHVYFSITYQGGYTVTSSGLSEGTLRILALTILPYLNTLPGIVFLEEPENGIHPRAIEAVLQSLSSAYDAQLFISTHSPVVLANSELDQILCARLEANGAATIIPGTAHPQLRDWKGQVDLGALFAAGVLG
ncbi:MAG: AAA family ATPase [Pseudomonadota bacterium]